eukprot:4097249-Pleurochrysis_carterae.AAC.1
MANATGIPRLHSAASCLCAAHAPASTQALRSGALRPLPLLRPSRFRLHPLACFLVAPSGLQIGEFSPSRAKSNTTNEGAEQPADFSSANRAFHGARTSLLL